MSPIDSLFQNIYGFLPTKLGTAYEMLAAVAMRIIQDDDDVYHDQTLRGDYSKTRYQIDVLSKGKIASIAIEAKDYSVADDKVGRGDIQKLAGAMIELGEIRGAHFYSATGYTKPASEYAKASKNFIPDKSINLYEFRESIEADEEGFIKTIVITIHCETPMPSLGEWKPHISKNGAESFIKKYDKNHLVSMTLSELFDSNGNVVTTLHEITSKNYGVVHKDTKCAHGCFYLPNLYINYNGDLYEIMGLEYKVPHNYTTETMEIKDDSKYKMVLKNSDGKVIRFFRDEELKQYGFDKNGKVWKIY